GDHYFGLPGLLTTMGLMNREQDLHLHAPAPLKQILDLQFSISDTKLPFELYFHSLEEEGVIAEDAKFCVESFKVFHRIECWGFIVREKKKPRKIDKDRIINYDIPTTFYERLKAGEDYTSETGEVIRSEDVTIPAPHPRSYAYCADTIYNERITEKLKDITLL